jgi:tRNA threonylcarbamoyladenosine biosynthesis protein TsaB
VWLALDTSTLFLSLALVERSPDGWTALAEEAVGPPRKHSEMLPGSLESLLDSRGLKPGDLEGWVVGLGPGSFTGLRVGLACAKGLAYATKRPIAGASSLAAVALGGPEHRLLHPLALSRRGELYVGSYRREGTSLQKVAPEAALSLAACAQRLVASAGALALGPAVIEHRAALEALGVPPDRLQDGPAYPPAKALVPLATLPSGFDFAQLSSLEPHYIGSSGAERHAAAKEK